MFVLVIEVTKDGEIAAVTPVVEGTCSFYVLILIRKLFSLFSFAVIVIFRIHQNNAEIVIIVKPNPNWYLSLAKLSPSLFTFLVLFLVSDFWGLKYL